MHLDLGSDRWSWVRAGPDFYRRVYDEQHKRTYFWCERTNESLWEHPRLTQDLRVIDGEAGKVLGLKAGQAMTRGELGRKVEKKVRDIDQTGTGDIGGMLPITPASGGFASHCGLDLDYMSSAIHYGLYLAVTAALCFVMNVDVVNIQTANPTPAAPQVDLRTKKTVEPVEGQSSRKKKTVQPESQPSAK